MPRGLNENSGVKVQEPTQLSIDLLRDGLAEARAAVRSYDTKAQILGIGYIFALGVVGRIGEQIPTTSDTNILTILVAWAFVVFPILLFGYVLYPTRYTESMPAAIKNKDVKGVLYIHQKLHGNFEKFKDAFYSSDLDSELMFEFLEVSKHRDKKRRRFLRALFAAAFCFVVLFTVQLLQSYRA